MKHKNFILTEQMLDWTINNFAAGTMQLDDAKAFFKSCGVTINAGTKTRFIKELTKLVNK